MRLTTTLYMVHDFLSKNNSIRAGIACARNQEAVLASRTSDHDEQIERRKTKARRINPFFLQLGKNSSANLGERDRHGIRITVWLLSPNWPALDIRDKKNTFLRGMPTRPRLNVFGNFTIKIFRSRFFPIWFESAHDLDYMECILIPVFRVSAIWKEVHSISRWESKSDSWLIVGKSKYAFFCRINELIEAIDQQLVHMHSWTERGPPSTV